MAAVATLKARPIVRKNVVFDPASAERISAAVKWVEQFYLDESKDPANFDPDPVLDSSTPLIIVGTFNGVWETDTEASVTWTSSYGTVVTPATNYLAPVGQANEDTVCVIGLFEKLAAEYVLLAAVNDSSPILRGQFDGLWAQNTTSNVTVTVNSTSAVYNATNLFGDVGEEGVTSDCVILQAGDEWILVSAEARPFFSVGTFDGSWSKGAYKTVTTNNSGTVNVLNLFADVNDSGDSGVSCAIAYDGLWYLTAAEC